jgi:hypothetical protein
MFFLTPNILKKILSRDFLFDKSLALPYKLDTKLSLYDIDNLIILLVTDITYFETENIIGIELYDGTHVNDQNWCTGANLDEKKWHMVDRAYTKNIYLDDGVSIEQFLTVGSVIILKEYNFEDIILKVETDKLNTNIRHVTYLEDILKITDFIIIGKNIDVAKNLSFIH